MKQLLITSLLAAGLAASSANAATFDWDGGGATANWTDSGNWVGDPVLTFDNTTDLVWATTNARNNSIANGDLTIRSITFNSTATNKNLGVGDTFTLTFDGGGSGATITVNSGADAALYNLGTFGTSTDDGFISLADNLAISHNGTGILRLSRPIQGTGNITQGGTGNVDLTATNSYTGTYRVNSGALSVSAAGGVGFSGNLIIGDTSGSANAAVTYNGAANSKAIVVNAGSAGVKTYTVTANHNHTGSMTLDGDLSLVTSGQMNFTNSTSGAGTLTKSGAAALVVTTTGILGHDGDTINNGGLLRFQDNAQLQLTIGANGINNQLTGNGTGSLQFGGDLFFDLSAANTTIGNTWNVVNLAGFTSVDFGYTSSMLVTSNFGAFTESANVWTLTNSGTTWQFSEATGNLTAIPEPSIWALLAGGLTTFMIFRRRRLS